MRFGEALALHETTGIPIRRAGWNGKGMWVARHEGWKGVFDTTWDQVLPSETLVEIDAIPLPREEVEILPCMIMKTADNKILYGWLASQTDIFADDWELIRAPTVSE